MKFPQERLACRLGELGIATTTVPYPAHRTVEEGRSLRGRMSGTFTKNLLLKDKKKRLFLIVAEEDRVIDLKSFNTRIGAKGHLSFASAELMREVLGVDPGTATPFGLINDLNAQVTTVIDASLMSAAQVNFHPLVQTASTGIRPDDLLIFIRACGREPLIVEM
ncbi:MAG: prolyl-tRNA synthetase associated domain-containing protein [Betaproteobacteria bacterium]|nr:MAG: prolyl-tRNA synthetase associated domain-containing protein [Betaproteobacteria bacterium]